MKKQIYKFISIFVIAVGVGLLCYALSIRPQSSTGKERKIEKIRFAAFGELDYQEMLEELAERFWENTGIQAEVFCFSTKEEMELQVREGFAKGEPYDVFLTDRQFLTMLKEGNWCKSLDGILENSRKVGEDFYPAAIAEGKLDGRQYGMPVGVNPEILIYNKNIFADIADDIDIHEIVRSGKWTKKILEKYLEKGYKKYQCPQLLFENDGSDKNKDLFLEGRTLFFYGTLEDTVYFGEKEQPFEWDILPAPSEDGDFGNCILRIPMIGAAKEGNLEAANAFIKFYVGTEGQKLRLEYGENILPSLNTVFYTGKEALVIPEHSNYLIYAAERGHSASEARKNDR
jgi:ABC-type glycerol-3-phosphate transport system substrate-binding protein